MSGTRGSRGPRGSREPQGPPQREAGRQHRPAGTATPGFTWEASDGCALRATRFGSGPAVLLLHGGGPDHHSLLPLAVRLADAFTVLLPDLRGYGRSVCRDPELHTWSRYTADALELADRHSPEPVAVVGTGLGATIGLRAALARPDRVGAVAVIGAEEIEDDTAKAAETAFLDAFAARILTDGPAAAWEPALAGMPPLIGAMVRDAIPRSDPASTAAACAIGRDRAFRDVHDLAPVTAPVLVVPGGDPRHPVATARAMVEALPRGELAPVALGPDWHTADDLATGVLPALRPFLLRHAAPSAP
ncbi:alpha/beta fold hydrolase [Kitasatospora sp. NBC_00458]|uniref:alpha/beta fold hydrolase n=1 Tax=Kitasatospora sp. NBC_00458 TaxID=2903568 RepID=UPI002E172EC0